MPGGEAFQLRGFADRSFLTQRLDRLLNCKESTHSLTARDLFFESSGHWEQCRSDIEPARKAAVEFHERVSKINTMAEVVESITDATAKNAKAVELAARKGLSKLQSIPKVGQVIKAILAAVKAAAEKLEEVDNKVARVAKILSRVDTGALAVSLKMNEIAIKTTVRAKSLKIAGEFENTLIACTRKTKTCADNLNMETANKALIPGLQVVEEVSEVCPRTFETISDVLDKLKRVLDLGIFDKLEELLDKVKRALDPILEKIEDFMDEVGKHLTEAYCCTVPLLGQVFMKGVGQIIDVATCPFDSLDTSLKLALQSLIDFVNDAVFKLVRDLLDKLPELEFKLPVITDGKLQASTCTFDLPSVELEDFNLLEPIKSVFESEDPSLGKIKNAVTSIGESIRDDCKDAAKEIGKGLTEDCCKTFRPLRDGLFCDPTNHIPFKRCSQCESGKFSFHAKKAHVACGIDDTLRDFATDVGDGIKDAANEVAGAAGSAGKAIGKVGSSAGKAIGKIGSSAGKAIGNRAKKAGKRIKKFFG